MDEWEPLEKNIRRASMKLIGNKLCLGLFLVNIKETFLHTKSLHLLLQPLFQIFKPIVAPTVSHPLQFVMSWLVVRRTTAHSGNCVKHYIYWTASLLVLWLVEAVGQAALAAVVAVKVASHEDTCAALIGGTLTSQPMDFAILVDLRKKDVRSADQKKNPQ